MKNNETKQIRCCICGRTMGGYGNNPAPFKEYGRCCDDCNTQYVIPYRLFQYYMEKDEADGK